MSFKYFTATATLTAIVAAHPSITIKENGVEKTLYVVGPQWYDPKGGDRMEIPHGGRSYLATYDLLGPDNYYGVNLLEGSISYDVDLSQSGCSCNAALYLISMPAKDVEGNPHAGDSQDFYCDANKVNGQWCPEFDIMEANTWSWRTTAHKCDAPNDKGHYSNCDKVGQCVQIAKEKLDDIYGPGDHFPINTLEEFHVRISFDKDAHFTVEMSQHGETHSMSSDESCEEYLKQVKNDISQNMVLAVSSWGDVYEKMSWLDKDTGCTGDCNNSPTILIKNLEYTSKQGQNTLAGQEQTNSVDDYEYGNECDTNKDDDCAKVDCKDHMCKWSWPKGDKDKWSSKDAKCRCQEEKPKEKEVQEQTNSADDYEYGNECDTNLCDDCAKVDCKDHMCKWSWPKGDKDKWSSKDAKCRCQEEKPKENDVILY